MFKLFQFLLLVPIFSAACPLFGAADLPAFPGKIDLWSHLKYAEELSDIGKEPVRMMLWVVGGCGWGAVPDQATLEPGQTRVFSCGLRRTFSDKTPILDPNRIEKIQILFLNGKLDKELKLKYWLGAARSLSGRTPMSFTLRARLKINIQLAIDIP